MFEKIQGIKSKILQIIVSIFDTNCYPLEGDFLVKELTVSE